MDACDDPRLIYLPPWCDGGPEYGPRTSHEYERAWRDWTESIYGGGLWDSAQDAHAVKGPVMDDCRERYDSKAMAAFATRCWCRIPDREREVYGWYWLEGLSIAATARTMGISQNAAYCRVKDLRRRLKQYTRAH